MHALLEKRTSFSSVLSQHFERFLGMHQLFFCPFLKIKVLLKMLTNFFKKNLKTYLTVKKKLSLFNLNISSLPYHFQDLNDLLKVTQKKL